MNSMINLASTLNNDKLNLQINLSLCKNKFKEKLILDNE
jgi:hypothetical protein